MRVKSKEWIYSGKKKNVRRRIKRMTHKQERKYLEHLILEEAIREEYNYNGIEDNDEKEI
jgi:hypothetical protein